MTDRTKKSNDPVFYEGLLKISEIREKLKETLKPSRFDHTLGVAYTAAVMAMLYNEDIIRAETAGMLHDCAKNMSDEDLLLKCRENNVFLSDEEKENPKVLHAIYGRYMAATEFGIEDEAILDAIRFHTTGRRNMSLLEKIIFTADFIEPGRKDFPGLSEIRKLAFKDLDRCVAEILHSTIDYLVSQGSHIVYDTLDAYDFYSGKTGG